MKVRRAERDIELVSFVEMVGKPFFAQEVSRTALDGLLILGCGAREVPPFPCWPTRALVILPHRPLPEHLPQVPSPRGAMSW
jgi:hypothetical protein